MIGYLYLYKHNPNIDWQKRPMGGYQLLEYIR